MLVRALKSTVNIKAENSGKCVFFEKSEVEAGLCLIPLPDRATSALEPGEFSHKPALVACDHWCGVIKGV
jgi:hypothetical protein